MELYDYKETVRKSINQQASAYGWWLSKPYQNECFIQLEPLQGDVPCEFVAAVEHAQVPVILQQLERASKQGPVAGKEMRSVRFTVTGVSDTESPTVRGWQLAVESWLTSAGQKAGAVLLEPIFRVNVLIEEEDLGLVIAELNQRRGVIEELSDHEGHKEIRASVPASRLDGWDNALDRLTRGTGVSGSEFLRYAEAPEGTLKPKE